MAKLAKLDRLLRQIGFDPDTCADFPESCPFEAIRCPLGPEMCEYNRDQARLDEEYEEMQDD